MDNRIIKFRAWTKIGNDWIKSSDISEKFGVFTPYNTIINSFGEKDIVWQQFTGLEDKNGVDIYEGDFVEWSEYQGWEDSRTFIGYYEVKWNEDKLRFDFYDPFEHSWWELTDTQFDCIIGNIFENPDLIIK